MKRGGLINQSAHQTNKGVELPPGAMPHKEAGLQKGAEPHKDSQLHKGAESHRGAEPNVTAGLEYSPGETFTTTERGGHYISAFCPHVQVSVPPGAVDTTLHVTLQVAVHWLLASLPLKIIKIPTPILLSSN